MKSVVEATLASAPAMPATVRLHPADDVVIARHQLVSGMQLADGGITVRGLIPAGHKVAVKPVAQGQPVRRYGQIIGFAKRAIEVGEHVHVHNLAMGDFDRDYAFGADAKPSQRVAQPASFSGHTPR